MLATEDFKMEILVNVFQGIPTELPASLDSSISMADLGSLGAPLWRSQEVIPSKRSA